MKGRDKRKLAKANAKKRKGSAPCKNKPGTEQIAKIARKVRKTFGDLPGGSEHYLLDPPSRL